MLHRAASLLAAARLARGINCEILFSSVRYVVIEDTSFIDSNYSIVANNRSNFTMDNCSFVNNTYAINLYDHSGSVVMNSNFSRNRNAAYLENALDVTFINCTFEGSNDSSISAIFSKIYFSGTLYFANNFSPDFGGAMYLHGSKIIFLEPVSMVFHNNTAVLSGGVMYSDSTFSVLSYQECLFQFSDMNGTLQNPNIHFHFANNTAYETGSILYASLYNCILDRTLIPNYDLTADQFQIFGNLSKFNATQINVSVIAADPPLVCLCVNGSHQCQSSQYNPIPVFAYPGQQQLTLSLGTVDEYNGTTPAVVFALTNYSIISVFRTSNKDCLDYNIPNIGKQQMLLITEGTFVGNTNLLWLSLEQLPCPLGFKIDPASQICVCIDLLRLNGVSCLISNQTILKPLNSWIGVVDNSSVTIGSYCPGDRCDADIAYINLSSKASLDLQCIDQHTGILCGGCLEGLSLTLGSMQCKQCTGNYHLLLLVLFAALGVMLVAFLFFLNLTVSVGSINGIIFYANIIYSNGSVIFQNRGTNGFINFLSVFISWINLDFGIDTCFYDGLDSYGHAWLQFAFPVYILILIVIIIVAGRLSNRVSRLCRRNVVPVIATLLLLLYTKILRNVVAIFSFQVLHVDDDDSFNSFRWLPDPNVGYLDQQRHIVLFTAGVVMNILYILPLTTLLLFTPCLQMKSHWKPLQWVNKLKPFLDSYQAPFKDHYRFWTGALLLVRFVLYSFVTINSSAIANLLAVVLALLFPLVCILGLGVYKKWGLTIVEGLLYSNAVLLTMLVYLKSTDVKQDAVVVLGVGSVFFCFVGITVYHIIPIVYKCMSKKTGSSRRGSHAPINVAHDTKNVQPVMFGVRSEFID